MNTNTNDAQLIARLGGPSKVAEMMGIDKRGGAQRIQNWLTRGIPSHVKVKHPEIFMPELAPTIATAANPTIEAIAQPEPLFISAQRRQGGRREKLPVTRGV